ncbi:hypothetical protein OG559_19080 [Micromonospora sp. NBC_01405]|uniref:hypothetical protein n=1 Tax=Micromonospora sp. NBC_01405 TaxID=2903589 RepID=UPI0032472277
MRRHLTASAIALTMLAGCGAKENPQAAADPTPSVVATSASPSPSPSYSPSPASSTSPPAPPSPTPAWAPCDLSLSHWEGGCDDDFITGDTCDASYASDALLDVYIENKDYVDANRLKDCPQFLPTWKKAQHSMDEGSFEVGAEIKPGTYETTAHLTKGKVTDCYWERAGSNGRIIANNFITAAKKVRVTIRSSDEMFTSRGCGNWVRV